MLSIALTVVVATGIVGATDDAFTMNTFRCDVGGWRVTTPAGWVLTPRTTDDPKTIVEVNATKQGTKGNVVLAWHKGTTLAALKTKLDALVKTPGTKVTKKPALDKARPVLRAEYDVDAGGIRGRSYEVAVASAVASDVVVEVTIPGAGPAADYADLRAAVDAFADAVVFEAPQDKPWAHKKNVEHLVGKMCSTVRASLTFDGAGHLVVDPGEAKTYYDLVGDDAKVAIPGKDGKPVEVACVANARDDKGRVLELVCGKTVWRADHCGP